VLLSGAMLLAGELSRAMLASARLCCFSGRMLILPSNQQRQSIEGSQCVMPILNQGGVNHASLTWCCDSHAVHQLLAAAVDLSHSACE